MDESPMRVQVEAIVLVTPLIMPAVVDWPISERTTTCAGVVTVLFAGRHVVAVPLPKNVLPPQSPH